MQALSVAMLLGALGALGAAPANAATKADDELAQAAQPQPGNLGEVQTLVGVKPVPPAPAGGGAPPPGALPPIPGRFAEPIGPFTMFMEVLASAAPSQAGLIASPGCVTDSVYKRGMRVIFRFEVYDMDNRLRVTSGDGSTAQVNLPDGSSLPAFFAPRAGPGEDPTNAPWTWVTVWRVPTDFPLGPVLYSVDVTTPDGRTASITPPSIPGQPVQPGVPLGIAGTYPTIIP